MKQKNLISTTLLTVLLSGVHIYAKEHSQAKKNQAKVKCKGVSTQWVNDCSANGHKCSGKAKTNFDKNEWLYMSQKDCEAVKKALKDPAVKNYVEKVQKATKVAVKRGKK